jgi:putative FmdB family regulatory protein
MGTGNRPLASVHLFPRRQAQDFRTPGELLLPRYDYECEDGHVFELKQSFNSEPKADCTVCGKPSTRKFSVVPIVFKGSGWYVNDYGKKGASSTSTNSKEGGEGGEGDSSSSESSDKSGDSSGSSGDGAKSEKQSKGDSSSGSGSSSSGDTSKQKAGTKSGD